MVSQGSEFQCFPVKIQEIMDSEQLEYFENVITKVKYMEHPISQMMRF